jgi:lipopolysaccharide transport system permease protein
MKKKSRSNTTIIESTSGWRFIDYYELIKYRDLLYFMVLRGIKAKYAQSVLGIGWAVIQPLVQTVVFTIVFGNLAKIDSEGIPYLLFSFVAMVPWNYFSNILTEASDSLVQNKGILSKVYFPRIIMPLSAVFSKLLDFVIGLIALIGLLFYYGIYPKWELFMFPIILLILVLTSLGTGMLLSAMAVKYRDVNHAMTFMVRLLMYGAPVVYSINVIPSNYLYYYALNPMVGVIEGMRSCFILEKEMPWDLLLIGGFVSLILFSIGGLYFTKVEQSFADVA